MVMTIVSLIVLRVLNCRRLALAFVLVHQYTKTEEVDEKNQMISECLPVEILDEASLVFLMWNELKVIVRRPEHLQVAAKIYQSMR